MWGVYERRAVDKTLRRTPRAVLVRYEAWKRIVELSGPVGLRAIPGFHDESLRGRWEGYRSSRLGLQWRVIYEVHSDRFEVHVIEVNPHDY